MERLGGALEVGGGTWIGPGPRPRWTAPRQAARELRVAGARGAVRCRSFLCWGEGGLTTTPARPPHKMAEPALLAASSNWSTALPPPPPPLLPLPPLLLPPPPLLLLASPPGPSQLVRRSHS